MNKRNWKRIGRTLATALLAGSLTVGAVSAIAPAVSPQPVIAAALTTTNYPYEDVNYGDNRASIYIDTTGFTATQLSAVNQGIANVQSMLAGIFTISVTNDKNQADMIISGHDFGAPSTTSGSRGGDTTITAVVNHIIQHPSRSSILLNNYYRSYATSVFFSPTYSPQLPATTDPNYQYYFDHYQAAYDKLNNDELILTTEHEIGHAIGLAHTDRDTYGVAIMNPIEAVDANDNVLASFTRDPTYIRAAQAIYGGQAIVLGETDVKQPTQGYHGSTAGSNGNSGNTGNGGNTGNTGNSGNNGNSGNTGNTGNGNTGNSGNTNNAGNSGNDTSSQKNTVKPASGTVNVYQASGAERYTATPTSRTTPVENYRKTRSGRDLASFWTQPATPSALTSAVSNTSSSVSHHSYPRWGTRMKAKPSLASSRSMFPDTQPGAPRSTTTPSKSKASSAAAPAGGYLPARP